MRISVSVSNGVFVDVKFAIACRDEESFESDMADQHPYFISENLTLQGIILVMCEDECEKTVTFLEERHDDAFDLGEELDEVMMTNINTGNYYFSDKLTELQQQHGFSFEDH
jgi:hypothetical protein